MTVRVYLAERLCMSCHCYIAVSFRHADCRVFMAACRIVWCGAVLLGSSVVPTISSHISSAAFFLMLSRMCFAGKFSSTTGKALYANFHLHETDCVTKTEDDTPVNARKPSSTDASWGSLPVILSSIIVYCLSDLFMIFFFDICPIFFRYYFS